MTKRSLAEEQGMIGFRGFANPLQHADGNGPVQREQPLELRKDGRVLGPFTAQAHERAVAPRFLDSLAGTCARDATRPLAQHDARTLVFQIVGNSEGNEYNPSAL